MEEKEKGGNNKPPEQPKEPSFPVKLKPPDKEEKPLSSLTRTRSFFGPGD